MYECFEDENNLLPQNKRRYINGENDPIWGDTAANQRLNLVSVSGYDCGTNDECIQADGSGYQLVKSYMLGGLRAQHPSTWLGYPGHCFYLTSAPHGGLHPSWTGASATSSWGMGANFDWLATAACNPPSLPSPPRPPPTIKTGDSAIKTDP